jgi:putative toxin-antitoxin system antitoxin component (TIGR02293 family)
VKKKSKTAASENIAEEAAVRYITRKDFLPAEKKLIKNDTESSSHIKRSLSLLGTNFTQPFSSVKNNSDFIACIRKGIPRKALNELMAYTGITINEITNILHISDRTLRRYTPQQKLNESQTERLIEIAKLYSRGEEILGSLDAFKEWMNSTVMALGNKMPKTFLDTSIGINMLMNELGCIEQGIFA